MLKKKGVIMICTIKKHKTQEEPHCLPCFLPEGASNVRLHIDKTTYLFDLPNGMKQACIQGAHGWHEVAPPR